MWQLSVWQRVDCRNSTHQIFKKKTVPSSNTINYHFFIQCKSFFYLLYYIYALMVERLSTISIACFLKSEKFQKKCHFFLWKFSMFNICTSILKQQFMRLSWLKQQLQQHQRLEVDMRNKQLKVEKFIFIYVDYFLNWIKSKNLGRKSAVLIQSFFDINLICEPWFLCSFWPLKNQKSKISHFSRFL